MPKRIKVLKETSTWRNKLFKDNFTSKTMTDKEFIHQINSWNYTKYHTRFINWIETAVSNPDSKVDNNLW